MQGRKVSKESYLAVVSENKEMLYRIAYSHLHDELRSLDAVDEAVYLGYVKRKDLKEPQYLKTWLVRILINECLRILRMDKREPVMELLPEKMEDTAEDTSHLRLALSHLEADLREVIALRYFAGFTIQETARILGIPDGTVSTRQRKALRPLRVELTEEEVMIHEG